MSLQRTSRRSAALTTAGVCLLLPVLLVAAILAPPLLWVLLLASLVIVSFDLVEVRLPEPAPVARSTPPTETAPRSPPRS